MLHAIWKYNLMDWLVKVHPYCDIFLLSLKEPSTRRNETNPIYEIQFDTDMEYEGSFSNTFSEEYQRMVSIMKPMVRFRVIYQNESFLCFKYTFGCVNHQLFQFSSF